MPLPLMVCATPSSFKKANAVILSGQLGQGGQKSPVGNRTVGDQLHQLQRKIHVKMQAAAVSRPGKDDAGLRREAAGHTGQAALEQIIVQMIELLDELRGFGCFAHVDALSHRIEHRAEHIDVRLRAGITG